MKIIKDKWIDTFSEWAVEYVSTIDTCLPSDL